MSIQLQLFHLDESHRVDEIVFENRHQAYGAYNMRSTYESRLMKSFIIVLFLIGGLYYLGTNHLGFNNSYVLSPTHPVFTDKTIFELKQVVLPKNFNSKAASKSSSHPLASASNDLVPPRVVDANHSITQIEETHPSNPIEDPSISGKGAEAGAENASIGSQTGSDLAGRGSAEIESNNTKAIDFVDELPEYEGGDLALRQYLQSNLHFPRMAIDMGISGIVYVQFLVDKNGNIKDISVLKDIQGIFGTEAINAIKGMKKWKPAKYHGQNVGYFVKMPINFQIK